MLITMLRSRKSGEKYTQENLSQTFSNKTSKIRVKRQICDPPGNPNCAMAAAPVPQPILFNPSTDSVSQQSPTQSSTFNKGLIPAIGLSVAALLLLMNRPLTNVPSNLPQPGSPGGGAQPTGNEGQG